MVFFLEEAKMYELVQVGEKTYYINCPVRMGIYKISDSDVCLIDSGNDKHAAKKVLKILTSNAWNLKSIFNTHSHADHIGGNSFLQERTGCKIFASPCELAFIEQPELEPTYLYGGFPFSHLKNKFLLAEPSKPEAISQQNLPNGLEMLLINGHSTGMLAFKTSDEVWFLADSLMSEAILEKYHIAFLFDMENYLQSLDKIKDLEGKLFIPAHAEPTEDIQELVKINRNKVFEIIAFLQKICAEPSSFEHILKSVFEHYKLTMDFNQYALVGSTIRSYLSYMYDKKILTASFSNNNLYWQTQYAE